MSDVEVEIHALAALGDGVGKDGDGRVTFVPQTAPGDRVLARVVRAKKSFAHGALVRVIRPGPARVEPPCPHFREGCGGCQWQHVSAAGQRAAKQQIAADALRKLDGLVLHEIASPAPPLGWRRRARFHVERGRIGLYRQDSHELVALRRCPQLEPALDRALAEVSAAAPPDGELHLLLAHDGAVAVAVDWPWPRAASLIGRANIAGVLAGDRAFGAPLLELEPGLASGPRDFAQASRDGNAALIAQARAALGTGPGTLVELFAGAGNLTRAFVADGWRVIATDGVAPARSVVPVREGEVAQVLAQIVEEVHHADAVVLDPPRAGAAQAIAGIVALAPRTIVYVSCDVATLARDAQQLAAAGYRATDAWPLDLMPQTAHLEVVLRVERIAR